MWALRCQAIFWRVCMSLGMVLHRLASPRPMSPSFRLRIPATFVADGAAAAAPRPVLELVFYVPGDYDAPDALSPAPSAAPSRLPPPKTNKYAVVINFHGGGFTLGAPTDDSRWATAVVRNVGAVVVSVGYRLAPEAAFPAAVADAVDAIVWLHRHADSLRLDRSRMALSGFSAGGNLCFTAALRLRDELMRQMQPSAVQLSPQLRGSGQIEGDNADNDGSVAEVRRRDSAGPCGSPKSGKHSVDNQEPAWQSATSAAAAAEKDASCEDVQLRALVAWYPSIDYTRTREARRASNPGGASKSISKRFTSLFDAAYLRPLDELTSPPANLTTGSGGGASYGADNGISIAASTVSRYSHPYLSPSSASDDALLASLPRTVVLYTCEWDGLHREGEDFRQRLQGLQAPPPPPSSSSTRPVPSSSAVDSSAIDVRGRILPRVRHGWDRSPTFAFHDPGGQRMAMLFEVYDEACNELRRAFYTSS